MVMVIPFRHYHGDIPEENSFDFCKMGGGKSKEEIRSSGANRKETKKIVSILGVQGVGKSTGTHTRQHIKKFVEFS
jgi:predicted AAA+ superfamily ATPase